MTATITPSRLSPIRQARADALHHYLTTRGRDTHYLSDLYENLTGRGNGWTRREVDTALDDLAECGWIAVKAGRHGNVMVSVMAPAVSS